MTRKDTSIHFSALKLQFARGSKFCGSRRDFLARRFSDNHLLLRSRLFPFRPERFRGGRRLCELPPCRSARGHPILPSHFPYWLPVECLGPHLMFWVAEAMGESNVASCGERWREHVPTPGPVAVACNFLEAQRPPSSWAAALPGPSQCQPAIARCRISLRVPQEAVASAALASGWIGLRCRTCSW